MVVLVTRLVLVVVVVVVIIPVVPVGIALLALFDFHITGIWMGVIFLFLAMGTREQGIGGGDIKLVAAVGVYLGGKLTLYGVIIGLAAALFFALGMEVWSQKKGKNRGIPLAPFLSFGFAWMLLSTYW